MFDNYYFDKYSHQKSWFGFEKGLRPFLYRFWMRQVRKITDPDARVLEVGCGLGYFLQHLERERQTFGIDVSAAALEIASKRLMKTQLLQASAENIPLKQDSFHLIVAMDVIEHLPHPAAFFSEARRLMKKNGYLIFSTPNVNSFGAKQKGKKPELRGLPYDQRLTEWYGWRDETHISMKSIAEWQAIVRENGFTIIKNGTDTLWDVPYFSSIPYTIQKIFFISAHWILTWLFGFFSWQWGENYICIARKVSL